MMKGASHRRVSPEAAITSPGARSKAMERIRTLRQSFRSDLHHRISHRFKPKLTHFEEVEEMRQRLRGNKDRWVVDPSSRGATIWGASTFFILAVSAILTPYEAAFLTPKYDVYFIMNVFIDIILVFDMFLQFFLAYTDEKRGRFLVKSQRLIARRYLSTWFLLDFISVIPIDEIALAAQGHARRRDGLSVFRLVRLFKLIRVSRFERLRRNLERRLVHLSVSYKTLTLIKLSISLFVFAHWAACAWGIVASPRIIGNDTWSWIKQRELSLLDGTQNELFNKNSPQEVYTAALYFSTFTMTGIGYGDIYATTHREAAMCCAIIFSSALFWAYIIANFCAIVTSINFDEAEYQRRLDDLNAMMNSSHFSADLKNRCRSFMVNSRNHQRMVGFRRLDGYLSLALRRDVAAESNATWVEKLWYMPPCSRDFIVEICSMLTPLMYAPLEIMDIVLCLHVLQSGLVAKDGKIFSAGSCWGDDFILSDQSLIDRSCASSLSYTLVMVITRNDFFAALNEPSFGEERIAIARAARYYELRHKLVKWARRLAIETSKARNSAQRFLGAPRRPGRKSADFINTHINSAIQGMHTNSMGSSMGKHIISDAITPVSLNRLGVAPGAGIQHRDSTHSISTNTNRTESSRSQSIFIESANTAHSKINSPTERFTPRRSSTATTVSTQHITVAAFGDTTADAPGMPQIHDHIIESTRVAYNANSSLKEVKGVLGSHGRTLNDLEKSVSRIVVQLDRIQRSLKDMNRGDVNSLGHSGSLNLRRGSIEDIRSTYSSGDVSESNFVAHPHLNNLWPVRRNSSGGASD